MRAKKPLISLEETMQTSRKFDLVDAAIAYRLYYVCSGKLIEHTTMSNVVGWLNLKVADPPIKVKSREKTRCCYFFKEVSNHLINMQYQESWILLMLKSVGISENHYRSHTYEVGVSNPDADKKLMKEIQEAVRVAELYKLEPRRNYPGLT